MGWTSPSTWTTSQVVTATNLNEQVRDNMTYVHSGKPYAGALHNEGSAYTIASATFANVDGTDLSKSLTTTTGRVLILFTGTVYADAAGRALRFDVTVDGTRIGSANTNGLCQQYLDTNSETMSFAVIKTGLSNGSHTFNLQWQISAGTGSLFSDTTTTPVIFQVIEL